jgi:hypothetical protein
MRHRLFHAVLSAAVFLSAPHVLADEATEEEAKRRRMATVGEIARILSRDEFSTIVVGFRPPDADQRVAAMMGSERGSISPDFFVRYGRLGLVHTYERIYGAPDDPPSWFAMPAFWRPDDWRSVNDWGARPILLFLNHMDEEELNYFINFDHYAHDRSEGRTPSPLHISVDGLRDRLVYVGQYHARTTHENIFKTLGVDQFVSPGGRPYVHSDGGRFFLNGRDIEMPPYLRPDLLRELMAAKGHAPRFLLSMPYAFQALPYAFVDDLRKVLLNLSDNDRAMPGPYKTEEGRMLAESMRSRIGTWPYSFDHIQRDRIVPAVDRASSQRPSGAVYEVTGRLVDPEGKPLRGAVMVTGWRESHERKIRTSIMRPLPAITDEAGNFRWVSDVPIPRAAGAVGFAEGYAATQVEFEHNGEAAPALTIRMQKGVSVVFDLHRKWDYNANRRWDISYRLGRRGGFDSNDPTPLQEPLEVFIYDAKHRLPAAAILPDPAKPHIPLVPCGRPGEPIAMMPGRYRAFLLLGFWYHDAGTIEVRESGHVRVVLEENIDDIWKWGDLVDWQRYGTESRIDSRLSYWLLDVQEEFLRKKGADLETDHEQ